MLSTNFLNSKIREEPEKNNDMTRKFRRNNEENRYCVAKSDVKTASKLMSPYNLRSMHNSPAPIICWNEDAKVGHAQLTELLRTFGGLLPRLLSTRPCLSSYASKLLQSANLCFALLDGSVVGMLALYANDYKTRVAYIPLVFVSRSAQRKGIGRALMTEGVNLARQNGMGQLGIEVRDDNTIARNLYESLGFRYVSKEGASWKMELDLGSSSI